MAHPAFAVVPVVRDRSVAPRPGHGRAGGRPTVRRAAAVLGLTGLLGALVACGTPEEPEAPVITYAPGVTATEVLVGSHHPLTGPAAEGYATIATATSAYFAYINANGGINGREIRYLVKDDGYNPVNTQAVVEELVLDEQVFAMLNGLGTPHAAVLDFLAEHEVPDVFVASGSLMFNQPAAYPQTFAFNPDYVVEAKVLATYVQETFPDERYCFLGQDDDLGQDFRAGLVAVLGEGAFAVEQTYSIDSTDLSPQVMALAQGRCEVNFLAAINGFSALTIGTAAQLAYHPQWVAGSVGGDYSTVSRFLGEAGPALLEGFVSTNWLPSHFDADNAWTTLFRQVHAEYIQGMPFDGMTVYGMSVAYLFAEALANAGQNPTREGLVTALTSGLLRGNTTVPLALSGGNHVAYSGVGVNLVQAGVQEYVGLPYTTGRGAEPVLPYGGGAVPLENNGIPVAAP